MHPRRYLDAITSEARGLMAINILDIEDTDDVPVFAEDIDPNIPPAVIEHKDAIVGFNTKKKLAVVLNLSNNININWINLVKLESMGSDRLFVCGKEVFIAGFDYMYVTNENLTNYIETLKLRQPIDAIKRKITQLEAML